MPISQKAAFRAAVASLPGGDEEEQEDLEPVRIALGASWRPRNLLAKPSVAKEAFLGNIGQ